MSPLPRPVACALLAALALAACDEHRPGGPGGTPHVVTTKSGIEMVRLPGGWLEMGSDAGDEVDEPAHRVYVSPFCIDRHEVTQADYERLMGENLSRRKHPQNPAEQVRWPKALQYCNERSRREGLRPAYDLKTWACDFNADGYRLPTEAEWEYAARAGTATRFFFGDRPSMLARYAWCKENATRGPSPVATREPNPWGLYDVYGNVWEWCHDLYGEAYYRQSPERNPRGPAAGQTRVIRGGSWDSRPSHCRSAYRNHENPAYTDVCFRSDTHGIVGFRCVRRADAAE